MNDNKLTISIPECAERLGLSTRTIWRMIGANQLPSVRLGGRTLLRADKLAEALDKLAEAPTPRTRRGGAR